MINPSQNMQQCQWVTGGPSGREVLWYQHTAGSLWLANSFSGTHAVALPLSSANKDI